MRIAWNIGPMGDFGSNQTGAANSDALTCNCNGNPPASSRTVRKEGPNKGLMFNIMLSINIFLRPFLVYRSPVLEL
jgi:hypothetical protein